MTFEEPIEKWSSGVATVTIGATASEGGTRCRKIDIGGATTLPFLTFEGITPNKPVIAMEVLDCMPSDWPETLIKPFADVIGKPGEWAAKCVSQYGAEMICLKLEGIHPDSEDKSPDEAVKVVEEVLKAVDVPLVIWGCDVDEKDNIVLPACSQAAAGERCLIGTAKEDNYKTLVASCMADGHALIAESPLDINIAKQLNVLISEMGFPLNRVVMYPTTGGLGYGIEYAYSIQERGRLAALMGDKMMSPPVVCQIGQEAWNAKEAKATTEEAPHWGPAEDRGIMWEAMTAVMLLQAGSDLLIMRHPRAVAMVNQIIDMLMSKQQATEK